MSTMIDQIPLEWNVLRYNINAKQIQVFNIFHHTGFLKDVVSTVKKYGCDKEMVDVKIRSDAMYHFWSRSEYEVIVTPFSGNVDMSSTSKIDIYYQLCLNWRRLIDYIYDHKDILEGVVFS